MFYFYRSIYINSSLFSKIFYIEIFRYHIKNIYYVNPECIHILRYLTNLNEKCVNKTLFILVTSITASNNAICIKR